LNEQTNSFCRQAKLWRKASVASAAWLLIATIASAADEQVPWDMQRLGRPPAVELAETYGAKNVHAVLFAAEPWKGQPTKVYAYYGFPDGANKSSPVPGVVCVHGGSGTAFAEWVQVWNKHGFAAIAIDTNGAVPKSINENPDSFRHAWAGPMRYGFGDSRDDIRDQWPYHAVANIILADSLLRSFPEVDADNIGITGISWGGYLTSLTAGIDRRFKFAIPVYGCGFLDDGSTWEPMIEEYGHDRWMQLWDPSSYLGKATMPMLWINGTNDKHYHLRPFQRSYRLPSGPRSLAIRVRMDHGHGSGWSPPEIYAFAKSIVGRGKKLIEVTKQACEGRRASVIFQAPEGVEVAAVELAYTSDRGPWVDREWKTGPAEVDSARSTVEAELPSGTAVYYFNLTDSRGLLVSSEHVEVSED
jgi:dienelactone hydrolase